MDKQHTRHCQARSEHEHTSEHEPLARLLDSLHHRLLAVWVGLSLNLGYSRVSLLLVRAGALPTCVIGVRLLRSFYVVTHDIHARGALNVCASCAAAPCF